MAVASGNARHAAISHTGGGLIVAGLILVIVCTIIFLIASASGIAGQFQSPGPVGVMLLSGLLAIMGLILAIGAKVLRILLAIEANTRSEGAD